MTPEGWMSHPIDYPDDRFEWVEITSLSDPERKYIVQRCKHVDAVPVESVTGDIVAHLCLICDRQLGARHGNSSTH